MLYSEPTSIGDAFQLIPGLNSTSEEIIAILASAFFCFFASAGGIGGGALYMSIFLLFGIDVHAAVPLSKSVICGGAIAMFLIYIQKRNPSREKEPLVAWDFLFLMEPGSVLGTILGSILNIILPQWALIFCELLLLAYTSVKMLRKARKIHRKELMNRPDSGQSQIVERSHLLGDVQGNLKTPSLHTGRLWLFLSMFFVVTALSFAKDGSMEKCSGWYWATIGAQLVITVGTSVVMVRWCSKDQRTGPLLLGLGDPREVTQRELSYLPLLGIAAGMVASTFGLGGGILKNPVMLSLGVSPISARATSISMIAFTSSSTFIQYLTLDAVSLSYAWPLVLCGALAFPVGWALSSVLVRAVGSQAPIPYSTALLLALSVVLVAWSTGWPLLKEIITTGLLPGLNPFCV
eukprot:gnl/Dysnectes_brevis/1193_a1334_2069.p1 GENE.gnl/Dysnectes_brevis/1193_a1334_2069~~gnl/Dysnectes_brevis/1193_a1334_2069.p1  ORF type:complete len:406 (+),score=155.11 gnl/Dysnectes_brevis/1193_a1334_2069:997-2214(+)